MSTALRTAGLFGDRPGSSGNRVRAALWSTYFHRFHNHWSTDSHEAGPPEQIPGRYRPLSPNQAMRTLNEEARGTPDFPRSVLRGAASQVVWSQYRLDDEGAKLLSDLVGAAERAPSADGFDRLRARGDPFQRRRPEAATEVAVDDRTQLQLVPGASSDAFCQVDYVEVRCTGILTVLAYEIVLGRPLEDVAHIVDPRSWPLASPAFLEVKVLQSDCDPGPPGKSPWHGRYFEHVVVNWNLLTTASFEATLKVDVSVDPFEVRTDYSLVKEKSWQLANDYGFVRARRQEGQPGVTVVTAEKCVTYRSPWMNFMSPAVMSMVAGQWAEALRNLVDPSEAGPPVS